MTNKLNEYSVKCHEANIKAGWWTDMNTGESLIGKRDIGNLIGLVHSEISEAREAAIFEINDDKLPHRDGFQVEIGDACIRLFDIAGAYKFDLIEDLDVLELDHNEMVLLMDGDPHIFLSRALEGFRKSKLDVAERYVNILLLVLLATDEDIWNAIDEKMEYNASRADHKVENRKKEGGKLF